MSGINELIDPQLLDDILLDQNIYSVDLGEEMLGHILDNHLTNELLNNSYFKYIESNRALRLKSLEIANDLYMNSLNCYLDANWDDLDEALININNALLYVPHEGEGYQLMASIIYQRSITLSTLGDFDKALKNANQALNLVQTDQLWVQKVYCLWSLKRFEETIQTIDQIIDYQFENPELRYQLLEYRELIEGESRRYVELYSHEKQKFIIPDLKFNRKQCKIVGNDIMGEGRHMVAIDDIPAGTAILTEKAQLSVLFDINRINYCLHCFKDITNIFWPCLHCNECVFCDQICYERAKDSFHMYECTQTDFLIERLGEIWTLVFRLIRKSMYTNAAEFCQFMRNHYRSNYEVFDIENWIQNHSNSYGIREYDKDVEGKRAEVKAILTFWDHRYDKRNKLSKIYESLEALFMATFIKNSGALQGLEDRDIFIEFSDYLIGIKLKMQCNAFDSYDEFLSLFGVGVNIYIIGSFINHSCDPNVLYSTLKGRLHLTANRMIRSGEELSISYGPTKEDPFAKRQLDFKGLHYCFCACSLCRIEIKQILSLRCPYCSGPVFYSEEFPNSDCYNCRETYDNMNQTIIDANFYIDYFYSILQDVDAYGFDEAVNNLNSIYLILIKLLYDEYNVMINIKETVGKITGISELPKFEAMDDFLSDKQSFDI